MKREKTAWLLSILLVAVLALNLPGSLAPRDDDYAFVRTLIDIHRLVAQNYVEPVNEGELREGAIGGMLGELDPFTLYVPPARQEQFDQALEGTFKGVGIQLDQRPDGPVEVVSPIDGTPAHKAGVLPGDTILKVNGETVEGTRLQDVIKKIAGKLGSEVKITVRHLNGKEEELTMQRAEIVMPTVKGYQRKEGHGWDYYISDNPKIAYMRVTQFTSETYAAMRGTIEDLLKDGMKGLILDLRFNPGGQLESAVKVVDMLIDPTSKYGGVIVSTRGRNRPETVVKATAADTLPYFPMIVLVNEHSASAAEIVAGSLMDNGRALVVGERSYGKGSVQELIPLEQNGGELKLTVSYYYLPSGRLVHRKKDATDWGVNPQIPVQVDAEQERKAFEARLQQELFKRPMPKATPESTTRPTTAPVVDVQLQRAVDAMMTWMILGAHDVNGALMMTTRPSTQAATAAATRASTRAASAPATRAASGPSTRPATTRAK